MLKKKSKTYFLYKKIKEYEIKLQYHTKWSIRKIKTYEKRWKYVESKYRQVNIYGIEFVGIGEVISRLFMYLKDEKLRDKNVYHIVLPTFFQGYYTGGVVNKKIFEVFRNHIHFVTAKNIEFWKYVSIFHSDKICTDCFDTYKYRDSPIVFDINVGHPLIPLTCEMEKYASEKLHEMGITGEFICIHAREMATKTNNFIAEYENTSVLDANINTYAKACFYMSRLGYQVIRLGKDESKKCEIEGVIDYANNFYDELMDFYLIARCKFLIGCSSGITAIASFWGRPVLQTNLMIWCHGQQCLPWTDYDLYIPKKFYSKKMGRFLNLYEMWDISFKCDRKSWLFEEEGIQLIDNTEEEILNAVIEMNEKLEKTWVKTEDEKKCIERYWKIMDLWKSKRTIAYTSKEEGGLGEIMYRRQICYSYLKDNLYLLELKETYENK